jgi:hypothetical protein
MDNTLGLKVYSLIKVFLIPSAKLLAFRFHFPQTSDPIPRIHRPRLDYAEIPQKDKK